jgi:uncharacterized membrane protein YedE/YeeE
MKPASLAVTFSVGLVFGLGLVISGMVNPAVVIAFLDVAGDWNPALALVMGGALAVALPAYAWARRSGRTLGGAPLSLPERGGVTADLVVGSAVFGVGWGLSGFCPGPAIVAAATGSPVVLIFLASMAAGFWLQRRLPLLSARTAAVTPTTIEGELRCG